MDCDPRVLATALGILADYSTSVEFEVVEEVPVEDVLAWHWSDDRLRECLRLLREGREPPPITVGRFLLDGKAYYVMVDGNHRTLAARQLGRERIRALVAGEVVCDPGCCVLSGDELVEPIEGKPSCYRVTPGLDPELIAALKQLGVAEVKRWEIPRWLREQPPAGAHRAACAAGAGEKTCFWHD